MQGSLRELGWIAAVIENVRTGNLIDGHERVWQALAANEDVPYLQVDLSEDEEKLALAVFDPITGMAETDTALLDQLLREVNTGDEALQQLLAEMAEDAGIVPSSTGAGDDTGSGNYREQYGVIVICDDEAHQEQVFNDLTAEGYAVKVVVT